MNDDALAQRISGRKMAEEIHAMAEEMSQDLEPVGRRSLWENIAKLASARFPTAVESHVTSLPMSDLGARIWGQETLMKYGKYAEEPIDKIPLAYLVMLTEDDDFKKQLRRYLGSPRIQSELEHDTMDQYQPEEASDD